MSGKSRQRQTKGNMGPAGRKPTQNVQKQKATTCLGEMEGGQEPDLQAAAAAFERELIWCIQQLEMGLTAPKVKQGGRQVEEAMRVLKILQNPKAPLVKKRQVMRTTFGDYRKKMADEEQRCVSSIKKMRLELADSKKQNKSTFLRKSSQLQPHPGDLSEASREENHTEQSISQSLSNLKFQPTGPGFKFDFQLEKEEDVSSDTAPQTTEVEIQKDNERVSPMSEPAFNYFKMEPSDNGFRFDFIQKDDT